MDEKTLLLATVVYPQKNDRILLGMKASKIGAGCWNGYGGGVDEGETIYQTAIRELQEESSLLGKEENLDLIAVVDFHNTKSDGTKFICQVHFFTLSKWEGFAQESEEMLRPAWFSISELPLNEMMPADREWLPKALHGEKIYAIAHYGPKQKKLLAPVEIFPLSKLVQK